MSRTLKDYCTLKGGTGFPEALQGNEEGDLPFIKVSDMSLPGNARFITNANNYLDRDVAARIGATAFPPDSTVFAKVGAALLLNRRRLLTTPTIIDNNMMAAIPTAAHPVFLYYYLCSIDFGNYVQPGALPSVNQATLGAIPFPRFEIEEQQKVAVILNAIDETIEQTEALIAKTQQIKAGLLHDLFTRGVAADGQLRTPREEAPQLYKESPLGWIPKAWDILALRRCLLDNPTNGIYKPADQIGRGTLLVGQTSFTDERSVDFSLARRAVVSTDELHRYALAEGNILLSRVFATLDGVGQPTLVPALPEPAVYESNMMRLRVDQASILPRLLFEWLRGHRARRVIVAGANASNQCSINQQVLNPLPILAPPLNEQAQMLAVIEADDSRAAVERESLNKLLGVKAAVMQDLLSGRVSVAVRDSAEDRSAANV